MTKFYNNVQRFLPMCAGSLMAGAIKAVVKWVFQAKIKEII
jgi:hypothetical protein